MSRIKGLNEHRLDTNPLEKRFSEEWDKQNKFHHTLEWLLSGPKNERADVSERDQIVAATVIQWLGSPVGQSFLEDALGLDITNQWYKKAFNE